MATYEITGSDGGTYEITQPDGAQQQDVPVEIPTATEGAPSPLQALIGAFRGTQRLPFQAGAPAEGLDPTVLAERASQSALSTGPGRLAVSAVSGATGEPGNILNLPGLISGFFGGPTYHFPIGSDTIAKQLGLDPSTMNALERSLQTVAGAVSPGIFLTAAKSVGILPAVATKLYRFVSVGPKMDIATGLGAAGGAELGHAIAPESKFAPLIGGVTGGLAAGGIPYAVKRGAQSPQVQKYNIKEQEARIGQKATEAFGGPTLQEQVAGSTTTQAAQEQALERFVETQKVPVYQAQASTQMAKQIVEGQQQRGRILRSDLLNRLRTSEDTTITALDENTQRLRTIESRIATEKETARQVFRATQEQGYQLSEDALQQRHAAQSAAESTIPTLEQERAQIIQTMKDDVKRANTEFSDIQVQARTQTKKTQAQVEGLEDDLARVTTASTKDIQDQLTFAREHTEKLAPTMAGAGTPEARARIGRETVQAAGTAGQDISERVAVRLRDNAAAKYKVLHLNYAIEEEAGTLNTIVARYKPALFGEDVVPSVVTEEVRGSYAPGRAIRDYDARVRQIAEDMKVRQNLTETPNLHTVVLGLDDMQHFRSRLMDDLRHTPSTSQNYGPLKQLYGEVNEYFWGLGRKYPEAFDELRTINHWYDTEVHRLMGDAPFAFANITNPLTRERLHTPDEVSRAYFGAGPGVSSGTAIQAKNEQRFLRYIDDLDSVMTTVHLDKERVVPSPTGYQTIPHPEATLLDAAAARNAKERLFDSIRVQFYDAATDASGQHLPAEAAKWLAQHSALIDGNAELTQLFRTSRNQANVLRDVQAKAQGLLALPEAHVQAMRDALKVTQAEGGEAVFQARLEARHKANQARLKAEQTEATITSGIAREQESLDEIRARLATTLREQRRQQQLARFGREDVQARTANEMMQASLTAEQERAGITQRQRGERRSLADERAAQTERQRQAGESLQRIQEGEQQALDEYHRMFGARNAAEHALLERTTAQTLGTTPEDIVAQMEAMNPSDRNFAYAQWFKKPEMGSLEKDALLQAMWRNFLGPDTVPDPQKAAAFIKDPQRQHLLKTYYPDYYKNITRVQQAFEQLDELAKKAPVAFTKQNIGKHLYISAGAFTMSQVLGWGWGAAAALGFVGETAVQVTSRALHHRKIAALNQIYLNPQDMAHVAEALRQRNAPKLANQTALSVLTRAGILGRSPEMGVMPPKENAAETRPLSLPSVPTP